MPRALVSVSDKRGVVEFARGLAALGFDILSTGGTAKLLAEAGVRVRQVSDYTGFPELLDGRVKTLHPKIHGGLLGRRDLPEHVRAMREHGIGPIDLVAVNLYPFRETIVRPGTTLAEAIEQIDIGGPSMLRSAAKNHAQVTVIVDPDDYEPALALAEEFRRGPEAAVAILKHNTPCGVGVGRDPLEAWERAYATDPSRPSAGSWCRRARGRCRWRAPSTRSSPRC